MIVGRPAAPRSARDDLVAAGDLGCHAAGVQRVGVDGPIGGVGVGLPALGLELHDPLQRVAAGEHGPRRLLRAAVRRRLPRADRLGLGLQEDDHARLPHPPPVLRVDGDAAAGGDDRAALGADLRQRLAFQRAEGSLAVRLEDLRNRPPRPPLDALIEIDERQSQPLRGEPPRRALARIRKANQKQMTHRYSKPAPALSEHAFKSTAPQPAPQTRPHERERAPTRGAPTREADGAGPPHLNLLPWGRRGKTSGPRRRAWRRVPSLSLSQGERPERGRRLSHPAPSHC